MNEYLAQLYGTADTVKEAAAADAEQTEDLDVQLDKLAAETFVETATEQDIDLAKLSEEDINGLYSEYYESFMGKIAEELYETDDEEVDEETQEKLAEADFVGRVMAHSYVQELGEIEKEAGKSKGVKGAWKGYVNLLKGEGAKKAKKSIEVAKYGPTMPAGDVARKKKLLLERAKQVGTIAGTAAVPTGAAAGGTAMALSKKKEAADEYGEAVINHAYNLLKEAGYDVEEPEDEKLASDIERDALKLLEANGYEVDWAE